MIGNLRGLAAACGAAATIASGTLAAQTAPQSVKGLEVVATGIERATNVSLVDCPPGANTQRGVIRPGNQNEFATVKVDFKTLPSFKPGPMLKPVLYDEAGKAYNTAQSFTELGGAPTFSCAFSFRVPKGARFKRLSIDTLTIDISALPQ